MSVLSDLAWPAHLAVTAAVPCADGETNRVYSCRVSEDGRDLPAFLKINRHANLSLRNERAVLSRLAGGTIPVPRVMAFVDRPREALLTEALPGNMVWDFIDPRRPGYAADAVPILLEKYGESLARIHGLNLDWEPQVRGFLYRLDGLDLPEDGQAPELLEWVGNHALYRSGAFDRVFVHGDLNVASVLINRREVSGVVDWEFAGTGWREYDLAWILRARTAFLNTGEERDAVLRGYQRLAAFDGEALRLAEVLVYLRFSKWTPTEHGRRFFLSRAEAAAAR